MSFRLILGAFALIAGLAQADTPTWIETSNGHAQVLLQARATFQPEMASQLGVAEYDTAVADLGPRINERYREAISQARDELERRLAAATDPNVRQDLRILIQSAEEELQGQALNEKHLLPYIDVPQLVFFGIQGLLQEQTAPERRAKAVERLRHYVGLGDDESSIFTQAHERFEERLDTTGLLGPVKMEVEQNLANAPTYAKGIRDLFAQYDLDADDALAALDEQIESHNAWVRETVMPKAREDFRLPRELYAFNLRQFGVDIDPGLLMQRAQLEFMETRAAMQMIAPIVAKKFGIEATDYRDVLRALKRDQLARDRIEPYYRGVIDEIDDIIEREGIVSLPERPMIMRLASEAETAAQPAPHMRPPPLVNNTGERGQFVLPLGNPKSADDGDAAYDDFTFEAAAWTLSAHEGRPGHELQFTAMVERGVSLARSLFAFNSVNVEGWALYAEAEMVPYEPVEGQLIALQFRLMRAARAMLDPMLNLGMITRERAEEVLLEDVVLSKPMARQELDRYTFRAPGQATSYFYGYTRILELRMQVELALGDAFDRQAFNDFLLDQGLLPPDLLAQAVWDEFVPAQRRRVQ